MYLQVIISVGFFILILSGWITLIADFIKHDKEKNNRTIVRFVLMMLYPFIISTMFAIVLDNFGVIK